MTAVDTTAPTTARASGPAPRGPSSSVVVQLARAESRRLARHPLIWGGVVLGAALLVASVAPLRLVLPREAVLIQFSALPIAAATLVAVHLATTRTRRDDVTELMAPAAHGEDDRTLALLLAVLTPTAVTAGLVAVTLAAMAASGAVGPMWWAEAATAPALIAGGGVVGVLLGRIAPWRVVPLCALVGLAIAQLYFSETGGPSGTSTVELLGPMVMPNSAPPDPSALLRRSGPHLAYVLGGVAVVAAAAALASRITPRRLGALTAALAVAATAGVVQMRAPADDEIRDLLLRAGDPTAVSECTTDPTAATTCALPLFAQWRSGWADLVQAVRAPLRDHGVPLESLTVAQRTAPFDAYFELSRWFDVDDVDVDRHIDTAWDFEYAPPDGLVLVTTVWPRASDDADTAGLHLALQTAGQATGLPGGFTYLQSDPAGDFQGLVACSPVGQAREPLTIWLAAQADPAAAGALRQAVTAQPYPRTAADLGAGRAGPQLPAHVVDLTTPAVAGLMPEWSHPGVHVALQMLDRPTEELLAELAGDWGRWTAPTTSLRDLVDELDLTMPPLAADLEQQLGDDLTAADLERAFRDTPAPAPVLDADGNAAWDLDSDPATEANGCP